MSAFSNLGGARTNSRRAGVEAVFHKLFDGRLKIDDNLPGGYLMNGSAVESLDSASVG